MFEVLYALFLILRIEERLTNNWNNFTDFYFIYYQILNTIDIYLEYINI
jgi:hypothetical protein